MITVACLQHSWPPWFPSRLCTQARAAACPTAASHVAWLWLTEYCWSQAVWVLRLGPKEPCSLCLCLWVHAHREANCCVRSASALKPPCCEETQARHVEGSGRKRCPLTTSIWSILGTPTLRQNSGPELWKIMIDCFSHCIVDLL